MQSPTNTTQLGHGEVASLIRTHDWTQSPLGDPESWPQPLCSLTSLILNSKFPMFVAWGPELCFIYNDAYRELLADKHPAALGRPFCEVWSDIWNDLANIVDQAMQGTSSYYENLPLLTYRRGYAENAWFTFSYSPVYESDGSVAGLYCAVTETTRHVLLERQRVDENERLRHLFQQAPGIMAVLMQPEHVFELVNDAYQRLVGPRDLIEKPVREALPELTGQGLFELLDQVYQTGEAYIGRAVPIKLQRSPTAPPEQRYVDFIYQPRPVERTGRKFAWKTMA